jgi:hypothetical protein
VVPVVGLHPDDVIVEAAHDVDVVEGNGYGAVVSNRDARLLDDDDAQGLPVRQQFGVLGRQLGEAEFRPESASRSVTRRRKCR